LSQAATFPDAPRVLGITNTLEKRVLAWLAARIPAAVNSDHLTALGFAAMFGAGAAYALSARWPWLLLAVNAALAVNWFGDSLDGTLARFRNRCRPRYGFYVDHMVDACGAFFLLGGLALSGYMHPWVAAAVLVAYFLLSIHVYLATYALGVFKIAFGGLGGTELRLLLAAANVAVLLVPTVTLAGATVRVFDLIGGGVAAALVVMLVGAVARTTRELYVRERL
jgi:archaetidylinositol phosphate synthase